MNSQLAGPIGHNPTQLYYRLRRIIKERQQLAATDVAQLFLEAWPLSANQIDELAGMMLAYRPDVARELIQQLKQAHSPVPIRAVAPKKQRGERILTTSPDRILEVVSQVTYVSLEEMQSPDRRTRVASSRFLATYFLRQLTDLSLVDIGKVFHRDHSTAIYAINRAEELQKTSLAFRTQVSQVDKLLSADQG